MTKEKMTTTTTKMIQETTNTTTIQEKQGEGILPEDTEFEVLSGEERKKMMELQPTLNVGTIGHVAHGKSTIVYAISGIKTAKSKKEKERGRTIHLGYANAKIYRCPRCPRPVCYQSFPSKQDSSKAMCKECGKHLELQRHVSFIDCPGHEVLMATMLNGAASFDAALLVVAANEKVPAPQTEEHLAAANMLKLPNVVTIQNKIDLATDESVVWAHSEEVREFIEGSVAEDAPVIPVSASLKANIDYVLMYLCEQIPEPVIPLHQPARLDILRSFDINKPGTSPAHLKGAVLGGTLKTGRLQTWDNIEIRPGFVKRTHQGMRCYPLFTKVTSISSEKNSLESAIPGGLIGIGTLLDPSLGRANGLVGNVLGIPGTLPHVYDKLVLSVRLMRRIVGMKDYDAKTNEFAKRERMLLNVGSSTVHATVVSFSSKKLKVSLANPVCAEIGQQVSLSRMFERQWRLVGSGKIRQGSVRVPIADAKELATLEQG